MRKKCSEKLKVLLSESDKYAPFIKLHATDTGTFVFMEAQSDSIADSIRQNAKQMGFRINESWERFFVFNYTGIPEGKYSYLLEGLIRGANRST